MNSEPRKTFTILVLLFLFLVPLFAPLSIARTEEGSRPQGIVQALGIIGRDVEYITKPGAWGKEVDPVQLHDFAVALSTMNFVQSRVSSLQYGYLSQKDPRSLPTTIEACLVENAGICGNQIAVFIELVTRLGVAARSVEFYWEASNGQAVSHVAAEVKYGGKWRYFDVTWGTYFHSNADKADQSKFYNVLSFEEIKALGNPKIHRITNESALAYQLQLASGIDPFEYLTAARTILVGKTGKVKLAPQRIGNVLRYIPDNKPNYVGWVKDYTSRALGGTSVALEQVPEPVKIEIAVNDYECAEGVIRVSDANKIAEVAMPRAKNVTIEIPLQGFRGDLTLETVPKFQKKPCYITFKEITIHSAKFQDRAPDGPRGRKN